jgi:hypothetical protein
MIKRAVKIGWPFVLALLIFFITLLASHEPSLIEKYYSRGLYPFIAAVSSFFSRLIPFSLWEIFWILSFAALVIAIILVIARELKLWIFLLRLFQIAAILYSFFYLSWGFNYFRPKIESRSGWNLPKPDESVFREVFDTLITKTNQSCCVIVNSDYPAIDSLVEKSFKSHAPAFGIKYPNGYRVPKKMILSSLFAKSGVSGYFGPFFNEVHVNRFVLPMEYPFVLAHEKAHQFGITEEAEANLAAFIICSGSDDRRLQYSGNVQLLSYFLSDAHQLQDRNKYVNKIDSLVKEDILYQRKHWRNLENKTFDKIQTAANNVYLKTNRIDDGVKNYNRVVALVISWYLNQKNDSIK